MTRFASAEDVSSLIQDNCVLGISCFGGWLGADLVFSALRDRFLATGSPSQLTVFGGILPGDLTDLDHGMNLLAIPGLLRRVIAAHVGMPPRLGRMISENRVEAFSLPLGVVTNLLHAAAGRKPGVLTHVGLGTFVDPRIEGGALNESALQSGLRLNSVVSLEDRDYLFYPVIRPQVCILRAGLADRNGSISAMRDPFAADQLEMALAVKAGGGTVIVQADALAESNLPPREVLLHSSSVDYIVVDSEHRCPPGYDCPEYRPELCGTAFLPQRSAVLSALGSRKICGRRGALELRKGSVINLGIGIPDTVAAVAAEEGVSSELLLSVESGPLGGVPAGGVAFGASANPEAVYRLSDNFDFYDGGGLDIAFLGAGEIDERGNVNVSKFGTRTTGPGGFINIVQSTDTICFLCTFTAGGLKTAVTDHQLRILAEGRERKFKKQVQQITFSADYARKKGQKVLYITERAVFRLEDRGLTLIEIAPGVDLEQDILRSMDFKPIISPELKLMDRRIFSEEPMGLQIG